MGEQKEERVIDKSHILLVSELVREIKNYSNTGDRYCFILGSGASKKSGIPTGIELEELWMREMEGDICIDGIRARAERLEEHLEQDYNKLIEDWEQCKETGKKPHSKYYFDIYALRFYPDYRKGYAYLEKEMENALPSFGYHPLAMMLASGKGHNLVITTNFDTLVEDALFMYTDKKPLVVNHEALADYASDLNIKRPMVAKIHRGLFFNPLNKSGETNHLKEEWRKVLTAMFHIYTPIVIGYSGGDGSLMSLLEDKNFTIRDDRIYWCYCDWEFPDERIQNLLQSRRNGYLVTTHGFDDVMSAIGKALFPNDIGPIKAEEHLKRQMDLQLKSYNETYIDTDKQAKTVDNASPSASAIEFKQNMEEIDKNLQNEEKEREQAGTMTAWDYYRQGNRAYADKNYDEAIDNYTKAIEIQSDDANAYYNRGTIYGESGEYDKAIADFNKAIRLNPNFAYAYNNRGNVYDSLGEYDKAIADYNEAIRLERKNADAYNNRGTAYYVLEKYTEAIADYNEAIKLKPDYAVAYYNRGITYDTLGDYEKAIADFNKAIRIKPDYADAYYNRGCAYNDLGEYDKAIADYNEEIRLNPDDADAYNNRGYAYAKIGNYDKAIKDCNKSLELAPDVAEAYDSRGYAYAGLGKYDEAVSDYTKAIEINPNIAEFYRNRAASYRAIGETEKAEADEKKAAELEKENNP